ncbi:iron-containing redox enzyme family protein [Streptomyces sp. NPDC026672]|uniref:iron-containing redox enzyme family protein n=1 Tax=unclassified Streptomyces TaxID=2593676 RepID=UPI0033FF14F1
MTPTLTAPVPCTVIDQRRLYEHYRSVPDPAAYAELVRMEDEWITALGRAYEEEAPDFATSADVLKAMREFLVAEARAATDNHRYLATEATREEFEYVVREFAVDGLTESLSLLAVVPKLPYRSGMAVFRVLIDELGCGNEAMAHAQLYRDLLTELGMPLDLDSYRDIGPESYAYVNLFHWIANRAPVPEYFLGGYAYFEASVLYGLQSFAHAAQRLGITNHQYYTEHIYIDKFHSKQMRTAIREAETAAGLDLAKVWAGVRMTSAVVTHATETAISRARGLV